MECNVLKKLKRIKIKAWHGAIIIARPWLGQGLNQA
jgi:hypothetical protein